MNTYEMVIKGNLDGTIVTPGDPSVSTLYQVVILPDDDPELMPPKGDPLSEDERTMIKRWILEGASEQPAAEAADPNATPNQKKMAAWLLKHLKPIFLHWNKLPGELAFPENHN